MRANSLLGTIISAGVWLGGISCSSAILMNSPTSKTADGWAITLSQAKEGPDEYIGEGGILVGPGDGQKLVWTLMTFRYAGTQKEDTFSYDTCFLSGPGQAFAPLVVDRHDNPEVNAPADKAESFAPGEERTRQLVFPYPKELRPAAVKCGSISLPIRASR